MDLCAPARVCVCMCVSVLKPNRVVIEYSLLPKHEAVVSLP